MTAEFILTIVSVVGGAIVVGVSGAFLWFKNAKARLYARVEQLEKNMNDAGAKHVSWHYENRERLRALEITNEHIRENLTDIKKLHIATGQLLEKLTQVMTAKDAGNGSGRG